MSDLLALTRSFIEGGPVAKPPEPTQTVREKTRALLVQCGIADPDALLLSEAEVRQTERELDRSKWIARQVEEIRHHRSTWDQQLRAELLGMRTPRTQQDWQRQMDYLALSNLAASAVEETALIPKLVEAELSEVRDGILYLNPEQPGDRERILVKHRL